MRQWTGSPAWSPWRSECAIKRSTARRSWIEREGDAILVSIGGEPVNVGSSELVSIDQLVAIVEEIAGVRLVRRYNLAAPKGVRGRNSDNTLVRESLGWEPTTRLATGMAILYDWIKSEMLAAAAR